MFNILTQCGSQLTKKGHDSEEVLVSTVAEAVVGEFDAGKSSVEA